MGRNSNKPMMRDTNTQRHQQPRVLLGTEKPSSYQSPSNHGHAMEGRGFDLGIHFHHEVSHTVCGVTPVLSSLDKHSTWRRREERQRNIGSLGNVVFCEILLEVTCDKLCSKPVGILITNSSSYGRHFSPLIAAWTIPSISPVYLWNVS